MKTKIFTKRIYDFAPLGGSKSKLIFDGDMPFQFRKDDYIQVLEGYSMERVDYAYYLADGSQEIGLVTEDRGNDYPEIH